MDYNVEDDDVDMPYAPPLQQAPASRCPYNQASRNSIHTPNTRYPPLMNPWTGHQGTYQMGPSMYNHSNMPPNPYAGAANYSTPLGYATQHTQWSQTPYGQSNEFPTFGDLQYQALESQGSRTFPTLPPPVLATNDYILTHSSPNDLRSTPSFAAGNSGADNNNNSQGMNHTLHGGAGHGREQAQLRRLREWRRERNTPLDGNMEASMQSASSPPAASGSEWDRPSARQARRLADIQRRTAAARVAATVDSDMDEDEFEHSDDDDMEAMLGYSHFMSPAFRRGMILSGKRMASKDYLLRLQSIDPEDLPKEDRACMICYNEYGIKNPEGVSEQPLRLPKCKHTFGATCLKTWFKDNANCPYCRDKIPSESVDKVMMRRAYMRAARSTEVGPSNSGTLNSHESHSLASGDPTASGWSTRASSANTIENRRRVNRGRTGSHRAGHLSTRPSSMSSVGLHTPPSQLQDEASAPQTHSRQNSNSEGVSPAIAVGSITNNGERRSASLSTNSLGPISDPERFPPDFGYPSNPYGPSLQLGYMRAPAFDPVQQENPSNRYNFQPQASQPENSVAFPTQQQSPVIQMQQQQQQVMQLQRQVVQRQQALQQSQQQQQRTAQLLNLHQARQRLELERQRRREEEEMFHDELGPNRDIGDL